MLTFSQNACDVGIPGGASVSVVTKPLVNGKFQRWVEGLVARHAGDAANGPANARWDAKHASLREGGASVADALKFQFGDDARFRVRSNLLRVSRRNRSRAATTARSRNAARW